MNQAADLDLRLLRHTYLAVADNASRAARPVARRLWRRIAAPQWTLEWRLPLWLGDRFRLDRRVAEHIVLSNVLGLGAVRLEDDLNDGEVAPHLVRGSRLLAGALYEAALDVYRQLLPEAPTFWAEVELRMEQWRSAGSDKKATDSLASVEGRAQRAAPLKISAFAVCELAGATSAFPDVEQCLDEALAAMVLYDHACDWPLDLAAGRPNAFVAACGIADGEPTGRDARHARVLVAMLTTTVVADYHAQVRHGLERAARQAERLDIAPLAEHLMNLAHEVGVQGVRRQGQYEQLGERATQLIFRSP